MELWMMFSVGAVFVGAVVVYLLFMIFLPEWVGITGKVALEAEKSHQGDTTPQADLIDKMHQTPKKNS